MLSGEVSASPTAACASHLGWLQLTATEPDGVALAPEVAKIASPGSKRQKLSRLRCRWCVENEPSTATPPGTDLT